MDSQQLKQTTSFRYSGSWLQENSDQDIEEQERLQGIGNAWRSISGIIYDKRMSDVDEMGSTCKKWEVAEMRCLRAIRGVPRGEKMRNEDKRRRSSWN